MALIELILCHSAKILGAGEAMVKIELFITGNIINSTGESFLSELGGKTEVSAACEASCPCIKRAGHPRRQGLLPTGWREG